MSRSLQLKWLTTLALTCWSGMAAARALAEAGSPRQRQRARLVVVRGYTDLPLLFVKDAAMLDAHGGPATGRSLDGTTYTERWRGNTMIAINPPGRWIPTFHRPELESASLSLKTSASRE